MAFGDYLDIHLDTLQKQHPIATLEASRHLAESKYELELAMSATKKIQTSSASVALLWLKSAQISEEVRKNCIAALQQEEPCSNREEDTGESVLILQSQAFFDRHSYAFSTSFEVEVLQHTSDIVEIL